MLDGEFRYSSPLWTHQPSLIICMYCGWDLAEWLEHLAVDAKVATVLGSIWHSGIWGAADEAAMNKVHTKSKKSLFICILKHKDDIS